MFTLPARPSTSRALLGSCCCPTRPPRLPTPSSGWSPCPHCPPHHQSLQPGCLLKHQWAHVSGGSKHPDGLFISLKANPKPSKRCTRPLRTRSPVPSLTLAPSPGSGHTGLHDVPLTSTHTPTLLPRGLRTSCALSGIIFFFFKLFICILFISAVWHAGS